MGPVLQFLRNLDLGVYYSVSRFADNWILVRLAGLEETNNLIKGAFFLALYWYLWFHPGPVQEKRRKAILTIPIAAVVSIVVARFLAFIVPFRIRPMDDPTLIHPSFPVEFHYNLEHWSSFPSDTAAYFFVLAFGIAFLSRRLAMPVLSFTAIWVCLTRVFLGIHFASDMFVGAIIGMSVAWASLRSESLQSLATKPALMAETRPQLFYPLAFLASFELASVFEGLRSLGNHVIHFVGIGLHIAVLRTGASRSIRPIDTWGGLVVVVAFAALATWAVHAVSGNFRHSVEFLTQTFDHYGHRGHGNGKELHSNTPPRHP